METDFFKTPLIPTTKQKQSQAYFSLNHIMSPTPTTTTTLLFPTQFPTTSMSSPLNLTLSTQSPTPQPKIQPQQPSSNNNNNNVEWNNAVLNYGPQMHNLSIRSHNYVNEYTEFVNKHLPVQKFNFNTKIEKYASSKINRRSSNNNNNSNNNLPSSSTIICNNNRRKNKTNNSSKILNGKTITGGISSPSVTTSATTSNCSNNNEIISLNSRNMQAFLKRCKTIPTTTATNNNQQPFLQQTLSLPGRGIVLKQHNQTDTYVIEEDQIENVDDDDDDNDDNDMVEEVKADMEDNDAAMHLSRTAQILRKFRIPKTTALLPKMVAANNKCLIQNDAPTPPPTVGTPNSTSSSVGFLEEVIEDDTETVIIEAPLCKEEILEESDEFMEENYLTDDGLPNLDNVSGNTVIMSTNNAGTAAPLQLQTLQPNGAITCINLPPNTILLSAADGTILATTAPAGSNNKLQTEGQASSHQQQQQQQLISLQDWSGNGSMLPQNAGTTTMLLTSDGNAIPILQQSMAAAAAANELLKTQVLA